MKPSPNRDRIAARYPDLLGLPADQGLMQVSLQIETLLGDVSALRKLQHSYRIKERYDRLGRGDKGLPIVVDEATGEEVINVEALTESQMNRILAKMQQR